ncbi:APC family permease [Metaclostridioides mangenotii]|uniref:APC family permease n=1 Tax=Metaclostridioides mangenotii TaxID=1540 RepID=UPI0004811F8E|nr:APC family permease [Clostridioides mangenotii]
MDKKLSIIEVFAIILGAIIGWGSFMLPGSKFLKSAGVINTFLGLLLGTMCIIIIERSYHMMIQENREEGGEFSYIYNKLGKNHGFVVGWFLSLAYLTMIPLNANAFPLVINKLSDGALEFGYLYTIAGDSVYIGEVLVSCIAIFLFMVINLKGIKETGKVQTYIIFLLILCVVIVFLSMTIKAGTANLSTNYIYNYEFSIKQILQVFSITPFLFVGFDAIPQLSTNFGFSTKKASMLAIIALFVGAAIYNLLNITTAMAYNPDTAYSLDWALGSAVMSYVGKGGFFLLVIALGAAVSSGINGFMICSTKLIGAIGKQKIIPYKFSERNKNGELGNSIIFVSIISFIAVMFGREVITWIVDMSSLGAAIAYFYVCLVTFMRKRAFRNKVIAFLGVCISVIFILLLLLPFSPAKLSVQSLIALIIWSILGFILWYSNRELEE